ncbi:ribonuclease H-like domain-containing protein [Tanacetum coccineum]
MSLSEYYHECNALWRQFNSLVDFPGCTCDIAPNVKKHSQLLRDESHRNSNVTSKSAKSGPTAFAARVSNLVCKHCNMTGHTIDRCFELDLNQKFMMGTGSERGGLYFLDEDDSGIRSNDPYDDGGDSTVSDSKTMPGNSTNSPKVSTVDEAAKNQVNVQTDNLDSAGLLGSTSSRKDFKDTQYATKTGVSEGILGTSLNNDEYDSEGEDIEYFGQLFESPQPAVGQNVRKSSRKSFMPTKYSDYALNKNVKYGIDTVVYYSSMSIENFVFTTSLNKIYEPSTYVEAVNDNRWVKYKANGEVMFKARLAAKGFNQREGIDYEETFSPVVKIVTIRCILSIAINIKWPLFQLDINNAFLYGELEADVYMSIPERYFDDNDKRVCKLVKSLYGLKQAPIKWNEKLTSLLTDNGFVQSLNDFSLFVKNDKDVMLILFVYVDDIIATGNNVDEINKFKQFFELLTEFGMLAYKPCSTPIEVNHDIKKIVSKFGDDVPLTGITNYQKLVGKLIYLTMTRPNISYVVHCLSQVMHSPMQSHLRLAFKVLRYLKGEPGLGNRLVSWKSKKQVVVSRSSTEAEYRTMCNVCCEVLWIKKVLTDLQVNISLPVEMSCDNSSAIQIAANPV